MVARLKDFLSTTPYNHENELRNIACSCCMSSELRVIDFDLVKDSFSADNGIEDHMKLKSADVLHFYTAGNYLAFIEMKRFYEENELLFDFLVNKLLEMPGKIVDSILIFSTLLSIYSTDNILKAEFIHPERIPVRSFLLCNASDIELVPLMLSLQDRMNIQIGRRCNNTIGILSCEQFELHFNS
jgi:hypothetical protein